MGCLIPALPTSVLPKRIPHGPQKSSAIHVSPLLVEAANNEIDETLKRLQSSK
jgi:P-type Mg2+ transporter